jgi:hypothetical protein
VAQRPRTGCEKPAPTPARQPDRPTWHQRRTTALVELNKRMADLMSVAERKRNADAQISAYDVGRSNSGLIAHPSAQQAVRFALAQRGKPRRPATVWVAPARWNAASPRDRELRRGLM